MGENIHPMVESLEVGTSIVLEQEWLEANDYEPMDFVMGELALFIVNKETAEIQYLEMVEDIDNISKQLLRGGFTVHDNDDVTVARVVQIQPTLILKIEGITLVNWGALYNALFYCLFAHFLPTAIKNQNIKNFKRLYFRGFLMVEKI